MPKEKFNPTIASERQAWQEGFRAIVGLDEAGRGAWAGPLMVGAVCLPHNLPKLSEKLRIVRDSKMMTALQRESAAELVKETALAWGVGSVTHDEIDEIGLTLATRRAMDNALADMQARFPGFVPDCLFLDALIWPERLKDFPQVSLVGGDARSLTIAAASVLAKTTRDAVMAEIDEELPQYGFKQHKGYGTGKHTSILKILGPSPLHRLSYKPVLATRKPDTPS